MKKREKIGYILENCGCWIFGILFFVILFLILFAAQNIVYAYKAEFALPNYVYLLLGLLIWAGIRVSEEYWPKSIKKYLKDNSKRILGRSITPHTLRHTHASLFMEQGLSVDAISRRLGHADSQITKEIYLHVTKKLQEKENEQIKGLKII